MNRWLIRDVSVVGHIHNEAYSSTWSGCLDFTLNQWVNYNSHVVELNNFDLQLNLVSNLRTLIGFLTEYIEYNGVLACESHLWDRNEYWYSLRLDAI